MNPGIDYGLGQTNIDKENGVRYGIISAHSLLPEALADFQEHYTPSCPKCGGEVVEFDEDKHSDYQRVKKFYYEHACEKCEAAFGPEEACGDEPDSVTFEDDGYKAFIDGQNDVWVTKSPYYTHAQFCSPCAPGAGHLNNPCPDGPKVYCFGHDWFEGGRAPYPVFDMKTSQLVQP